MELTPLFAIRLRTPRLELRLPTEEELVELYRVAEAGIHPPEEMPFEIPWTDALTEESFLAFHREARTSWSPERWACVFATFLDGRVIGVQSVEADEFATRRRVQTGSWLGEAFQRRGYGFEQRAAVLEFAFAGLGAETAVSGALVHNVASQRISDKLGYSRTGSHEIAPRGEPVEHLDYRLDRVGWQSPVAVEIEGLEPALPLFGAARSSAT